MRCNTEGMLSTKFVLSIKLVVLTSSVNLMKGHVHKYEAGLWTFGKRVNVIGFGPLKVID